MVGLKNGGNWDELNMMMKNSKSIRHSGAYTSPGTPEHGDDIPKSWSSERVALPTSSSSGRRHVSSAALMPFNNGRALPSKWDDAERWITSPISSYGSVRTSIPQPQRRAKSKSGPLGPSGLVYYSPNVPSLEVGKSRNFMPSSPLTTGVLVPDGLSIHYASKSACLNVESSIPWSTSAPGLSDLISETSVPSSNDDNKLNGGWKEEEVLDSRDHNNHRDMATQMSPEGSTHSSSKGRLSFSNLPSSIQNSFRQNSLRAAKDQVRDVQVDKGSTASRQSKKQGSKKTKETNSIDDVPSPWNDESENTSKLQGEEAKIIAWENLQRAKAEAAIRKLEMKLEKKRSASMEKIANKLKASQTKAQAMRNMLSENNHAPPPVRTSSSRMGLSGCIYGKTYLQSNCLLCRKK